MNSFQKTLSARNESERGRTRTFSRRYKDLHRKGFCDVVLSNFGASWWEVEDVINLALHASSGLEVDSLCDILSAVAPSEKFGIDAEAFEAWLMENKGIEACGRVIVQSGDGLFWATVHTPTPVL